jgi:hypothetical protein
VLLAPAALTVMSFGDVCSYPFGGTGSRLLEPANFVREGELGSIVGLMLHWQLDSAVQEHKIAWCEGVCCCRLAADGSC